MLDSNSKRDSADVCIVCCRSISLFAYGVCDHAVCYECSTRMRVLCEQNECPICRQVMPQVVFTWRLQKYADVDRRRFQEDQRHHICFEDAEAKRAFRNLLEHICGVCRTRPMFTNFQQLKDHMRREHEQFYCDLCVNNLKIFSFERKSYRRPELARHRRTGDPDNTSHRGHPLCEFCEERFLDQDELFRHLRREHFFCHFCDADGKHEFYSCYEDLLEHFRMQHYLCEEGSCKEEKFTSVFRTDIDLRAHRATAHNKSMTKAQAKQARTLEFEFTIAPRQRPNANGPVPASDYSPRDESDSRKGRHFHRRGRREESGAYGGSDFLEPPKVTPPAEAPTVSCSAEFPTLDGGSGPRVTVRGNSGTAESFAQRLARQNRFTVHTTHENGQEEEEFPSLTGKSSPVSVQPASPPVSARSSKRVMVRINSKEDFPRLPGSNNVPPSAASVVVNRPQSNVSIQVSRTTTRSITGGSGSGTNKPSSGSTPRAAQSTSWSGGTASLTESDFPQLASGGGNAAQPPEASWVTVKTNSRVRPKTSTSQVSLGSRRDADADFPSLGGTSKKNQKISSNRSSSSVMIPINNSGNESSYSYLGNNNENLSLQNVAESLLGTCDTDADASNKNKNKKKKQKSVVTENVNNTVGKNSPSSASKCHDTNWTTVGELNNRKKTALLGQDKNQRQNDNNSKLKENEENENPESLNIAVKRAELHIDSFHKCSDLGDVITADDLSSQTRGLVMEEADFPTLPPALTPIFNYQDKTLGSSKGTAWQQPTPSSVSGPPPGFIVSATPAKVATSSAVPPPGFSVTVNSVARSTSSDSSPVMFTNSSGENFAMSVVAHPPLHHQYSEPASFHERNSELINRIQAMVSHDSGIFAMFKALSGQFRRGHLSAADYYQQCMDLVGKDEFLAVFPELLVLLPDISKQQELLSVHNTSRKQNMNSEAVCGAASSPQFLVCAKCQQVLCSQDFRNHMNVHGLESNFPSLASAPVAPSSGTTWVKK